MLLYRSEMGSDYAKEATVEATRNGRPGGRSAGAEPGAPAAAPAGLFKFAAPLPSFHDDLAPSPALHAERGDAPMAGQHADESLVEYVAERNVLGLRFAGLERGFGSNDELRRQCWAIILGQECQIDDADTAGAAFDASQLRQIRLDVDRSFHNSVHVAPGELGRRRSELFALLQTVLQRNPELHYFQVRCRGPHSC